MNPSSPERPVFHSRLYIAAPLEKVWEAVVDPRIISLYYLAPAMELERRIGGRIAYGKEGCALIVGTVCEYEERERFGHTFAFCGRDRAVETNVLYRFEAVGEKVTLLELRHTGFGVGDEAEFADISGGWPVILSGLKTVVETGRPLEWT